MLARLWRVGLLGLAAAAVLWAVWLGRQGHWIAAIGGAIALLCLHAWVLALQFVLMWLQNRHDPAPPAHWHELLRAWWGEVLACTRVFGWHQTFREHALADEPRVPGRRGIVFIHGYLCNRALWLPWFERLRRRDVPYVSLSLEPVFTSIDAYVEQVEAAVRRIERATGLAPVLVCHSMGGLVARAWLRWQATQDPGSPGQGDARAHHVITIGTPHHGTWAASAAATPNGRQMRIGSDWLRDLARSETPERRRRFTCFYGHCDSIVFPASTAVLPDAQAHHVRACAHVQLTREDVVFEATLRWVDAAPAGAPALPAGTAA
jgi:triacylglycerol lipase